MEKSLKILVTSPYTNKLPGYSGMILGLLVDKTAAFLWGVFIWIWAGGFTGHVEHGYKDGSGWIAAENTQVNREKLSKTQDVLDLMERYAGITVMIKGL